MPQGGIDKGEGPRQSRACASWKEEIGTNKAEILAVSKRQWLSYDLPEATWCRQALEVAATGARPKSGSLLRFRRPGFRDIDLDDGKHPGVLAPGSWAAPDGICRT